MGNPYPQWPSGMQQACPTMPGRVATFVICSKTPSSNSERSVSVAKTRAGTSIPALWETGISQTVSEIRRISFGTDTVRLLPSALR